MGRRKVDKKTCVRKIERYIVDSKIKEDPELLSIVQTYMSMKLMRTRTNISINVEFLLFKKNWAIKNWVECSVLLILIWMVVFRQ